MTDLKCFRCNQWDGERCACKDGQTIFCGDCREILPLLPKVDLVLTDPPYGIDRGSGTIGTARAFKSDYASFEDTPENVINEIIPRFLQAMELSRSQILTPGPRVFCSYPQPEGIGVFYQPASCSVQRWGRADSQFVFYYGKDPYAGKTILPSSFQVTESSEKNGHPCPKPIRVWKKLLEKGSRPGETVLDPFLGSGTTLRACKDLGRRGIGIELEEKYCEIAANRLRQEVLF